MVRAALTAVVALSSLLLVADAGSCAHLSGCSGHGSCDTENSRCLCYQGYGALTDIALYKAPDCSMRAFWGTFWWCGGRLTGLREGARARSLHRSGC